MDQERRELLINRIISGILYFQHRGKTYKILPATAEQRYIASLKYFQYLEENSFENLPSQHMFAVYSYNHKLWTQEHDQELDLIKKKIEAIQIEMYHNHSFHSRLDTLRKNIALERKKQATLLENKNLFTGYSKEYQASQYKNKYLLCMRIHDSDNKPMYHTDTILESSPDLLESAMLAIQKNYISDTNIRFLARNSPWRNFWSISKTDIFANSADSWTDEQNAIAIYSRMYDNVYESHESPPEGVINDDDILDGWFAVQHKERQKGKSDKKHESKIKPGGHAEVMIPVGSREEAKEVFHMNDNQGKMEIRNRENVIKTKDEVKEQELPDVQMRIQREIIQQTKRK